MNDDQKRKFDAIATLRSWAWDSWDRRREFEWKMSLGIWTSLSALIGILFSRDTAVPSEIFKWGSVVIVLLVALLHFAFCIGISIAQNADRRRAESYESLLNKEFGPFLSDEIIHDKFHVATRDFSLAFQVCITLLLSLCLIAVAFSK